MGLKLEKSVSIKKNFFSIICKVQNFTIIGLFLVLFVCLFLQICFSVFVAVYFKPQRKTCKVLRVNLCEQKRVSFVEPRRGRPLAPVERRV